MKRGLASVWSRLSGGGAPAPAVERRASMPRIPAGMRIYAVGDVHGRADLLTQVFARIDDDIARRPAGETGQVMLGDYVDRGPRSREVLDALIARQRQHGLICLRGNHDVMIQRFLDDPATLSEWAGLGGTETLLSYGIRATKTRSAEDLAEDLRAVFPPEHIAFLESLLPSFRCGDYFFAHAGVRPGVALDQQAPRDLMWIREEFLTSTADFGCKVVHGHTPCKQPENLPNRLNIDTGAYITGRLTCAVLEDDLVRFL